MSYAEKPDDVTKEEWMDKLNNVHIQRADMNRLIMNYLVTGKDLGVVTQCFSSAPSEYQRLRISPHNLFPQRASRRQQRSSGWSLVLSPAWTWTH